MFFENKSKPLFKAIEDEDIPGIESAIANGAKLNATDADGNTALHLASLSRQITIVEWLLTQNIAIDAINNDYQTPLMLAVKKNHYVIAEKLLQHNASPYGAQIPLHVQHRQLITYILDVTILAELIWFTMAPREHKAIPIVSLLTTFSLTVILFTFTCDHVAKLEPPLITAIHNHNPDVVALLKEYEADKPIAASSLQARLIA